jgi:hypothetical protein
MIRIGWDMRIAQYDGKFGAEGDQLNAEMDELVTYMLGKNLLDSHEFLGYY